LFKIVFVTHEDHLFGFTLLADFLVPNIDGLETGLTVHVKHDDNDITVTVIYAQQRAVALLTGGVPDIDIGLLAIGEFTVVAVKAGAAGGVD
jgi:hypothetical protein